MSPAEALHVMRDRLTAGRFNLEPATIGGRRVLFGRRSEFHLKWWATTLHTFVVVFKVTGISPELAEELTDAAQQYAIDHKGGLPRGIQTGTATVAVFVTPEGTPDAREWFEAEPRHRFGALRFPVLVEAGSQRVTYFDRKTKWGAVYLDHLRGVARDVAAPLLAAAA